MRSMPAALLACALLLAPLFAQAAPVPGDMDVRWNEGSPDCKAHPQPPLQVHRYDARTFILREGLCATFEAPFMYLLVGSNRALLIDTGDVADPKAMPLARTVMGLLPAGLPLLVVHTHRHLDHRAGDGQFAPLPNVKVVGYDLDSVRRFYGFAHWPEGQATLDLGNRKIDVLPTPGHNETHVAFYDRNTGLFFSGDFLMPGRLLIDDSAADLASARRVAAFVAMRPVTFVLGGHVELDGKGDTFPWESQYHPNERPLPMTKADLLVLPSALEQFNGLYTRKSGFIMMNPFRIMEIGVGVALVILIGVIALFVIVIRRSLQKRRAA